MKNPVNPTFCFSVLLLFLIVFIGCKKDNDDDDIPDNSLSNIQTYQGAMSYDGNDTLHTDITLKTGVRSNGDLWLQAYAYEVNWYQNNNHYTTNLDFTNSEGIVKFNGNDFSLDLGSNRFLNGTLTNGGNAINGNFQYEFQAGVVPKGSYTATKN